MSIRKEFDKWMYATPIMHYDTAFKAGYLAGLEAAAKLCEEDYDNADSRPDDGYLYATVIRGVKETK